MTEKNNKLNMKDLINIGIFTAIYIAVEMVWSSIGYIPILYMLIPVTLPIIGGIPMMLYYTKIRKFGMILIFSILNGLLLLVTGMGYYSLICNIIFGVLAELIMISGKYVSARKSIFSYAVLSMGVLGTMIPLLLATEAQIKTGIAGYSAEYVNSVVSYMSHWWVLVALLAGTFIAGILGGLLGRKIFKKHFERGGIL